MKYTLLTEEQNVTYMYIKYEEESEEELKTFHYILNNLHDDINFTLEYDQKEQPVLDVMVRNKEGKIETDIFYKETDSKQYLLFSSCHPRHTKAKREAYKSKTGNN